MDADITIRRSIKLLFIDTYKTKWASGCAKELNPGSRHKGPHSRDITACTPAGTLSPAVHTVGGLAREGLIHGLALAAANLVGDAVVAVFTAR